MYASSARSILARASDCSFSTAASAESPLVILASTRLTHPWEWANILYASTTSCCSGLSELLANASMSSTRPRSAPSAFRRRRNSASGSSATGLVITTLGS